MKAAGLFVLLLACSAVGVANPDADNEPAGGSFPEVFRKSSGKVPETADRALVDSVPRALVDSGPLDGALVDSMSRPDVGTEAARVVPTIICDPIEGGGPYLSGQIVLTCPAGSSCRVPPRGEACARLCEKTGTGAQGDECDPPRSPCGRGLGCHNRICLRYCRTHADCSTAAPKCQGLTCDPAIWVCTP
jgi:hypothetical protein